MGRNKKLGLDYFPMNVDFFQDIRIRKLIKYQGGKAVTVYALLLCIIYKQGYYIRWDDELPFIISEQTGFDEAYIQEVFKCCMVVGLFSKKLYDSDKIITSKGIQDRYKSICDQSRRVCKFNEYVIISSEEMPISSEEMPISSEEMPISSEESTQRKEKKRKNKINPPYNPPSEGGSVEVGADDKERIVSEFFSKQIAVEAFCKNNGTTPEELHVLVDEILTEWELSNEKDVNARHLMNALRIKIRLKKKFEDSNDTKSQDRYSKRRGADSAARSAEDYTDSI